MRIAILLLTLILSSCATAPKPFAVPQQLEGGWKITTSQPAESEEWMTRIGLKQATRANYSGSIDAEAVFYELNSDAAALEAMQKWKPNPAESRFYKRNLFVVTRSNHPNKEMLMDFTRAIEKSL